jgi:hypothetical protein
VYCSALKQFAVNKRYDHVAQNAASILRRKLVRLCVKQRSLRLLTAYCKIDKLDAADAMFVCLHYAYDMKTGRVHTNLESTHAQVRRCTLTHITVYNEACINSRCY